VWYFRDVSDIIQFQVAQADSERRYRTAFQTTLDAIAVTTWRMGCIWTSIRPRHHRLCPG
jgi:PAS domain-containing protein